MLMAQSKAKDKKTKSFTNVHSKKVYNNKLF